MNRNVLIWLLGVPLSAVLLFNAFVGSAAEVFPDASSAIVTQARRVH